jgi:hypothetical protein
MNGHESAIERAFAATFPGLPISRRDLGHTTAMAGSRSSLC